MGIFSKTYWWRYEIAPMYMELKAWPLTADEQNFYVLCGLTSKELFKGTRLPQVGELIELPGFSEGHQVTSIRSPRLGGRDLTSRDFPTIIYFDPAKIRSKDYWCIKPGKMKTITDWGWSTNHHSGNYRAFGYDPSDWGDKKLKFKERDYVLGWRKVGNEIIAEDGKVFGRLDPKHSYLEDWFPEVTEHLQKLRWQ